MSENQKPLPKVNELAKMLLDRDLRTKAVDALELCLTATRSYYDPIAKGAVTEKDFKTIESACALILAYADGKPVERKEIISHNADSIEALLDRVKKSPELQATMRKLLEKPVVEVGQAKAD